MLSNSFLLAQASDGGAAVFCLFLMCVGLCWAVNKTPPTKTETIVGQKTTKYG